MPVHHLLSQILSLK